MRLTPRSPSPAAAWLPVAALAVALATTAPVVQAPAQPADGDPSAELHELWVPTARLGTVLRQMPEAVMLDRAEFERLQQAAARGGWPGAEPMAPPESALIRRADGELHDHGDLLLLEVRLTVESLSPDWSAIPLDLPANHLLRVTAVGDDDDDRPVRATLVRRARPTPPDAEAEAAEPEAEQSEPAPQQQAQALQQAANPAPDADAEAADRDDLMLLLQGEGRLELRLDLLLPARQQAGRRQFDLPPCPAPEGRVTMQRDADALLAPPFELIEDGVAAVWPGAADPEAPGRPGALAWQLLDAADPVLEDGATTLDLGAEIHVAPGRVGHRVSLQLRSQLRPLPDQLTVTLPEDAQVHRIDGPGLRDWSQDGASVELRLNPPPRASQRRGASFVLHYDVPLPPADDDGLTEHEILWPSSDLADHVGGRLVVNVGDGLRLIDLDVDEAMQLDVTTGAGLASGDDGSRTQAAVLPPNRERMTAAGFTGPVGPVRLRLRAEQPRLAADLDTRVVLRRHEITLTRRLLLRPLEGDVFVTTLTLPDDEQPSAVLLDDGSTPDWRTDGNQLTIHWEPGVTAGSTRNVTIESRRQPDGWFELGQDPVALGFTSAGVDGVDRLAGYVAVDFDDSFDVLTAVEDGLEKRDAATSPAAGRIAWFRLDDYRLELAVARRAPEVTARVMQHALPLAGSLEIEGGLQLDIRHSGLKTLQVEMDPAVAPALRWRSPQISEDRLDPETGTWTLVFREDIEGVQLLRWQLSLAHPELEQGDGVEVQARFANELPVMRVPSARRLAGHVVVEANTDTELQFEPAGLDPIDALAAPQLAGYQPRHRPVAAYRYRGDQWRLRLTGVRHVGQPLATVLLRDLDLVSVIGAGDEPVRHQLTVRLLASGEQFTEFGIGEGSRLLTLLVDDLPARPVAAPGGVVRVELPPASEGLIDCRIRLIWEQQAPSGWRARRTLAAPALPSAAPLLASRWTLHAPDGHTYSGFKSNLRPEFDIRRPGLASRLFDATDEWLGLTTVSRAASAQPVSGLMMPAAEMELAEAAADDDSFAAPQQRVYAVPADRMVAAMSAIHGRTIEPWEITPQMTTDWLAAQGVRFGEGAWSSYDAASGRLIVNVAPDGHDLVEAIVAAGIRELAAPEAAVDDPFSVARPAPDSSSLDPFAPAARAPERPGATRDAFPEADAAPPAPAEPVVTATPPPPPPSAPALGLMVDRSGIETLALDLPTGGRVFRFSGHEAPQTLTFSTRSWNSQIRFAWIMLALGAGFFWRFARTKPLARGVPGLILIAFVPKLLLPLSLWPLFNAMLLGWLAAMLVVLGLSLLKLPARWLSDGTGARAKGAGAATTAVIAATIVLLPQPADADQPGDTGPAIGTPVRVVVPYDPSVPVDQQPQRPVYLDRDTFEKLWKAARDPDAGDEPGALPLTLIQPATAIPEGIAPAAHARYEVELGDERVLIRGQLHVVAPEAWTRWPLDLGELPLAGLTVNDLPARLRDGHVLLEEAGPHVIGFTIEAAPGRGWQTLTQPLPPAHSAGVSIVAGPDWTPAIEVNDSLPLLEEALEDGGRSWTGALGDADTLKIQRLAETRATAMRPVASAEVDGNLLISPRRTSYQGRVVYRFPGGRQDRFTVDLDDQWKVDSFTVNNLRGWSAEPLEDGMRRFTIELAEPAADTFSIGYTLAPDETTMLPADGAAVAVTEPRVRAGAARSERRVEIRTARGVRATTDQPQEDGWRRVQGRADPLADGWRIAGTFVADGATPPLVVDATWQALERELTSSFVFQIGRDQLETIAILEFEQAARDLVTAALPLPADAVVQDVQGERLAEWVRVGDELMLRFDPGTRGTTPVMVYLSQPVADAANVSLQPLAVRDWPATGGRIMVVAHAAAEVLIDPAPGSGATTDLPADTVDDDEIMIVSPLETKRVLEFGEDGFNLDARVGGLDPQVEAGWVQLVEARDGYAMLRALVHLDVRRGAMESVRLHLPAGLPTAAISGPLVREVRRAEAADAGDEPDAASDLDTYEVSLQRDVLDYTTLEVALELPYALVDNGADDEDAPAATGRRLDLPLPDIEASALGGRYLLVRIGTQDEVRVVAPGARPVAGAEVPYLPDGGDVERVLAFAPGAAEARLEITELSTTAGSEAVVTLAELTSAIRDNGDIWTRATYRLLNRSRQFLPVELPAGAELISVRVDGVGVRADRGTEDGRPVVLVPLIQADAGQVAYPVEVTYRQSTGRRLGRRARPVLDDPNLPGISVQRTVWNLWLPEDYRLADRDGNMEPVTAELSRVERLSAVMGELDRLNTVLGSSTTYDSRTREQAWQNAKTLQSQLEAETSTLADHRMARQDRQAQEAAAVLQTELLRQGEALARNREVFERDVRQQQAAAAPPAAAPDGGRLLAGWMINDRELGQREQQRLGALRRVEEKLGEQLALNDNIAIRPDLLLSGEDMPQVGADEDGADAPTQQLRVGNTFNARQLELRQQIAVDQIDGLQATPGKGQPEMELAFRGRGAGPPADAEPGSLDDQAQRGQEAARAAAELGDRDAAGEQAQQVLRTDPYNIAARRQMITSEQERRRYYDAARDHSRERMLREVDQLWETHVPPIDLSSFEVLRSTGKVSLEVDFPLTGESVHFRKSSDHARLELDLRRRADHTRLPALFGLVGGLLGWFALTGLIRRFNVTGMARRFSAAGLVRRFSRRC